MPGFYACDTWSLTRTEKHKLGVFENSVLREIFVLKGEEVTRDWRKLHNGEHVARVVRGEHTEDCVEVT